MSFFNRVRAALTGAGTPVVSTSLPSTPTRATAVQKPNFRIRSGYLEADEPDFYGLAHVSPNKQWAVGCDGGDGRPRGGGHVRENSRVLLVAMPRGQMVREIRSVARPRHVAVSDVGIFAVHDSGFGSELSADAIAFDASGTELYRRHYSANIASMAISQCGRFLAVQTCSAPKSPDDSLLELHDLAGKTVLFSKVPETPWSDKYAFDVENGELKRLWVYAHGIGRFAYSATGAFVDAGKYQAATLAKGDAGARLMASDKLLRSSSAPLDAEAVMSVVKSVMAEVPKIEQAWQAKAYRLKGKALEILARPVEAITSYELALALDPKIGVKARLTALRKGGYS